jgi:hypothetical protein
LDDRHCVILENAALLVSSISLAVIPGQSQLLGAVFPFQDVALYCSMATRFAMGQNISPPILFDHVASHLWSAFFQLQVVLSWSAPTGWKLCEWQYPPMFLSFVIWGRLASPNFPPSHPTLLPPPLVCWFSLLFVFVAIFSMMAWSFLISSSIADSLSFVWTLAALLVAAALALASFWMYLRISLL